MEKNNSISTITSETKSAVAELLLPAKNILDIQTAQQFISSLPFPLSLEYFGHGTRRMLLVRGMIQNIRIVSGKISALYPSAELRILDQDPTMILEEPASQVSIKSFSFSRKDYLPIRIWKSFLDGDPVNTVLSAFLGLEDDEALLLRINLETRNRPEWMQAVLRGIKIEKQKGYVLSPGNNYESDEKYYLTHTDQVNNKKATVNVLIMVGWFFVAVAFLFRLFTQAAVICLVTVILMLIRSFFFATKDDDWESSDLDLVSEKVLAQDEYYLVSIYGIAKAGRKMRSDDLLRQLSMTFNQYSQAGGNSLTGASLDEENYGKKIWMSDLELSGLWHIPVIDDSVSSGLLPVSGVEKRIPDYSDVQGFYPLGYTELSSGKRTPVSINQNMLQHNIFLIGKPGTGKTTMMEHITMAAMSEDRDNRPAIIVIDPHGDMFTRLAGSIPEYLSEDIMLMDFGDPEYILPYNPLDCRSTELSVSQTAQLIIDIGKSLWADFWGPRMQIPLQRGIMAIAAHNMQINPDYVQGLSVLPTLLNTSESQRRNYISELPEGLEKNLLERYFMHDYSRYSDSMREQIIQPVLSKAYRFEESPMLEFFSSPVSKLEPHKIILEKKILLVNTRMSLYGSELSDFLGSLIVNIILREISRQGQIKLNSRIPVMLVIDEFQTLKGVPWQELLAQLRKWGGRTVLGTQSFASLRDPQTNLTGIVMSGVYSLISFLVNGEDASYLSSYEFSEKHGGPSFDTLASLQPFTCYAKFMREDNTLSRPFFFSAAEPVKTSENTLKRLMELRENYSILRTKALNLAIGAQDLLQSVESSKVYLDNKSVTNADDLKMFGTLDKTNVDIDTPQALLQAEEESPDSKLDPECFLDLLQHFPWISRTMLEGLFSLNVVRRLLQKHKELIKSVNTVSGGTYFALSDADERMLPGIIRRDIARNYVKDTYGISAFMPDGRSPCVNVDFDFFDKGKHYRLWVDMGYLSSASLHFVSKQPMCSDDVTDIILEVQLVQVPALKNNLEYFWKKVGNSGACIQTMGRNKKRTEVFLNESPQIESFDHDDYPVLRIAESKFNRGARVNSQIVPDSELSCLSLQMYRTDIDILAFIGDNPLMASREIAVVLAGIGHMHETNMTAKTEEAQIKDITSRILFFLNNGLVQESSVSGCKRRLVLSSKGIDYVAGLHNTIPHYMRKYPIWPQKPLALPDKDEAGESGDEDFFESHNYYSERWAGMMTRHQRLCTQFCLAMVLRARAHTNTKQSIEVLMKNSVSTSVVLRSSVSGRAPFIIKPDAQLIVHVGKHEKAVENYRFFVEIENSGNTKKNLTGKLNRYKEVFSAMERSGQHPVLLFVLADEVGKTSRNGKAVNREYFLWDEMKKRSIPGYSTLLSLLKLEPSDTYWHRFPAIYGNQELASTGYFSPFRCIWKYSLGSEERTGLLDSSVSETDDDLFSEINEENDFL